MAADKEADLIEAMEELVKEGQKLSYEVVLPAYKDEECARYERENDRKLNNEAFTEAIRGLFRVLKSWEDDDEKEFGKLAKRKSKKSKNKRK